MDELYKLIVRLSIEVPGVTAAADMAMRAFSGIESAATRTERTMAGIRLTMGTSGLSAGANEAMGAFRQLELQGGRMGDVFRGMNLSTGTQPLINAVSQAQAQMAGFETAAAAADRRVASLSQTMGRAIYMNGGTPPTGNRAFQWNVLQKWDAQDSGAAARAGATAAAADLTAAQGALQSHLQTQMGAVDAAMAAQQARMNQGMGLMVAGGALTAGGGLVAGFLDESVKRAMELQTVMVGIQTATGGTADQMQRLSQIQVQVGAHNQMTSTQVAELQSAALGAGLTVGATSPAARATMLAQLTQPLADFAEVLKMRRGMSPDQSAETAVEFAHQFGAYSTSSLTQMTNLLGRALYVTPGTPQEMLTLTSQFAGVLRPLYARTPQGQQQFMSDTIQTAALESILGQQTRGGTQIASMIARTLGGGAARVSKQGMAALQQLQTLGGGSFFDASGSFAGMANAMEIIGRASNAPGETPRQIERMFMLGFGRVGGLQAGILSEPSTLMAFQNLGKELGPNGLPTMDAIQQAYNQTPQGQMAQAQANWQTFETTVGVQLLPEVTKLASVLAEATKNLSLFANEHPTLTKIAVTMAAIAAGAALIAGPLLMAAGALSLLTAGAGAAGAVAGGSAAGGGVLAGIGGTIGDLSGLTAGLVAAAAPAAALAAALGGVIGILQWTSGLDALGAIFGALGGAMGDLGDSLRPLANTVSSIIGSVAHEGLSELQTLWNWIDSHTPKIPPVMPTTPSVPAVTITHHPDPKLPGSTVTAQTNPVAGIGATTIIPGAGTVGLLPTYPAPLGHIPQLLYLDPKHPLGPGVGSVFVPNFGATGVAPGSSTFGLVPTPPRGSSTSPALTDARGGNGVTQNNHVEIHLHGVGGQLDPALKKHITTEVNKGFAQLRSDVRRQTHNGAGGGRSALVPAPGF